jgi:undecaprenyl-diphosphatase
VNPPDAPAERIERSPADVLRLVVAAITLVLALLLGWWFEDELVAFGTELLQGFDAVPQWIVDVVVIGTRLLAVVVLAGGLVAAVIRGRWRMLVTACVAVGLAVALAAVLDAIDREEGGTSASVSTELGPFSNEGFPGALGLAAAAAALTAAAPWLSRRWRRLAWVLVAGLVVSRMLTAPVSFDGPIAAFAGWLCGAAVLVALGAPSRRPTPDAVVGGLRAVGLDVAQLEPASVDARGSTPYFGATTDGTRLFVKCLGRDERSADLLFRLYRAVQPRTFGDERPFESLRRAVEHEALVALAAASSGVRTPRVLAFANAEPNGYVLAYEGIGGRSLDKVPADHVDDELLTSVWRLVGQLRERRIAHRDLRLANIFLDDARTVWLIDFGFSELAASDLLLANDVAELLASSSLVVGAQAAVAHARAHVDPATLARARARLRPWALSGATRTALAQRPALLDELRDGLASAATAPAAAPSASGA